MADTALRTATAGYLTRRLVDVAQDVIIRIEDCKDKKGAYLYRKDSDAIGLSFAARVQGRVAAEDILHPKTKKVLSPKKEVITKEAAQAIEKANIDKILIRSLVTCKSRSGVCQKCYGIDLGRGEMVKLGQAVGIVAAQAIGEPGTQLTMRTFHIGGVAGKDITQGLPRVEEIFEARSPKGEALITEEDCQVLDILDEGGKTVKIQVEVENLKKKKKEVKEYLVSKGVDLQVAKGDVLPKGTPLSEGHIDLHKLYKTMGSEELHRYIVREIQEIYASQGEGINDKHIEVIIRQMLSRIKVSDSGDTALLPGDIVEQERFNVSNDEATEDGGSKAKGDQLIMGITKVALSTESFLSAASFQETARVLIGAAVTGKEDNLHGLKENVIIGRLIPAGTGYRK
jgi:DNA-directed RNA polymerase subunit beta'